MSKFSVSIGQMDSAERCWFEVWEESVASAWAAWVGEDGAEVEERRGDPAPSSSRRRLIASACRLGGPRRRLGLSKVHGMSSPAHARHGGPLSSHCQSQHLQCFRGGLKMNKRTFTLRILHESHALRNLLVFWF